jgi:hypothetical protein
MVELDDGEEWNERAWRAEVDEAEEMEGTARRILAGLGSILGKTRRVRYKRKGRGDRPSMSLTNTRCKAREPNLGAAGEMNPGSTRKKISGRSSADRGESPPTKHVAEISLHRRV